MRSRKDLIREILGDFEKGHPYPEGKKIQEYNWWIDAIDFCAESLLDPEYMKLILNPRGGSANGNA